MHLWATDKWYAYAASVDPFQAMKYQADLYRLASLPDGLDIAVWFLARSRTHAEREPWVEQQHRMLEKWPYSRLFRAAGSSHDIELDRPGLIVSAIYRARGWAAPVSTPASLPQLPSPDPPLMPKIQ
jgi:hypothetical protein